MRLLLLMLFSSFALADSPASFLHGVCKQGLMKEKMAAAEAARFCACVTEDVVPRLSQIQRRTLDEAKFALDRGQAFVPERFASSGVRDLVVAGQARCEAAFYPPSAPISIVAGGLHLTLRCEDESKKPEVLIYGKGMALLSKAELNTLSARLMKDNARLEYAKVTLKIDGSVPRIERWEIDLTGEIVAPPNSVAFIDQLRTATTLSVIIERGAKKFRADFPVSARIPARWAPCSGVGR